MPEDLEPQAHWIHGIGIGGYRSFGDVQKIGPFRKINLIIGQNNSGKSNVLRFLDCHYAELTAKLYQKQAYNRFKELDRHLGSPECKLQVWFGLPTQGQACTEFRESLSKKLDPQSDAFKLAIELLGSDALCQGTELTWFPFESSWESRLEVPVAFITKVCEASPIQSGDWQRVWTKLLNKGEGNLTKHWVPETMHALLTLAHSIVYPPAVILIPAIRQITPPTDQKKEAYDYGGQGLIHRLAKLRDPSKESTTRSCFMAVGC